MSPPLRNDGRLGKQLDRVERVVKARLSGLLRALDGRYIDGALDVNPPRTALVALAPWAQPSEGHPVTARTEWVDAIERDVLDDVRIEDLRSLCIDPRDGALIREGGRGGGLAVTPKAFGQAVNLMLDAGSRVRGVAGVLHHQLHPPARSVAFEDVRADGVQNKVKPALLRTYRHTETGLRTVRAVLSQKYPTNYFDDLQLLPHLDAVLEPTARARISRGVDETFGVATVKLDGVKHVEGALHWRNSETGAARLGFYAGLRITALDAIVSAPARGVTVDVDDVTRATREVEVTVAHTSGSKAISHTLPWSGWTEEERQVEARRRITNALETGLLEVRRLAHLWNIALVDFPLHFAGSANRTETVDVLMDFLEEAGALGADSKFRAPLAEVLANEERLRLLPFASAAHVAAAWAVIGRNCKTHDEQVEAQELGGLWVSEGWRGTGTGRDARSALTKSFRGVAS